MAPLAVPPRLCGLRSRWHPGWWQGLHGRRMKGIESLLTKTTFDICNLRLIGHSERMNASQATPYLRPHPFPYFSQFSKGCRSTLERFASSITHRILLVIFAAVVIAVELEK